MKTVTNLEIQKNNTDRFNVYLDNNFAFGMQAEIIYKYNIKKDIELSDEFIEEVLKLEEYNKAFNYCIYMLSKKDKTKKEITTKLNKKGYDEDIVIKTIEKLKDLKYINDEIYCKKFINDRIKFSSKGKNKIKMELYQKGVNKDTISEKIKEIDDNSEYERALLVGEKKLKSLKEKDKYKLKQKLFSHLVYKGFDFNIINKVIKKLII